MSLLCDFFIASPGEVANGNWADGPGGRFQGVEAGGLDSATLMRLEERLTDGARWQVGQNVIAEGSDWWVFELSAGLTAAIAIVTPESSEEHADKWQLSADEAELVENLGDLARQAIAEQKTMYAWISR